MVVTQGESSVHSRIQCPSIVQFSVPCESSIVHYNNTVQDIIKATIASSIHASKAPVRWHDDDTSIHWNKPASAPEMATQSLLSTCMMTSQARCLPGIHNNIFRTGIQISSNFYIAFCIFLPGTQSTMEELPEYNMNVNAAPREPVYLRREKESLPSLNPPKHPHGNSPPTETHPQTGQSRPLTYGNDNSSVNRQSRVQVTRPDPIPGTGLYVINFIRLLIMCFD